MAHFFRIRTSAGSLIILLLLGSLTHFGWLSHPDSVVFDEFHFAPFANAYCCSHEHIFDVHPPHGKLLIAGTAKLFGFEGMTFGRIGQAYEPGVAYALRAFPAFAGTLLPLIIFGLVRILGGSRVAAFFAGLLLVLDNAILVQTRIIALDGILLAATFGSLLLFLHADKSTQPFKQAFLFFLAGCAGGLALGIKLTGALALGLIGLCILVDLFLHRSWPRFWYWVKYSMWIVVGACLVYLLGWLLHFLLLTDPGPGDIWHTFSDNHFEDLITTHQKMFSANTGLTESHPDSSPWWSWPLMTTPLYYWVQNTAKIFFLGNPVIWWGSILMLLVVFANLILVRVSNLGIQRLESQNKINLWIPIVGYVASYGPLIAVSRILFMYHYLMPFIFSLLIVVLWLDDVNWIRKSNFFKQRLSFYLVLSIVLVGFIMISPLTFGLETGTSITQVYFEIFPNWN